jgi:Bifunctional DNA primase/polymerase, N-terminal/SNF2-related domain
MGMTAVCPSCGHAEPSSNRRGARLGSCPRCGTPMRAHTAGKAKGRYLCPVAGGVFTHGLGRSVELAEPMRLAFQPGWDNDRYEADPDRPGWNRPVTYHRAEPDATEQRYLDRAAGRVFGPGCVISGDFTPPPRGDRWHGRAGVYLIPAPDADPVTWFVNEPVAYKKCAACPAKVIASDQNRMDREWVPARHSYWRGSGGRLRRAEISQGPHPSGSYACRDCRPGLPPPAQAHDGLPEPDSRTNRESGPPPQTAADAGQAATEPGKPAVLSDAGAAHRQSPTGGFVPAGDGDAVPALHDAIGVISSVCDYARELDAQGFSAADTWLGHVLAQMPAGAWTGEEALAAWDMLRKYRGQLAAAGIGYDQLPRPAGAGELEAERREEARERARQRAREHARAWRDQQFGQAHTYLRCDGDGEQVTLAFPYDPGLVAACRALPGRRYDGATKANVFPFTSLPAVIELAGAHGIEVTADVRGLAAIAANRAAGQETLPEIRLDEHDGTIIIDAPFNPDLNQALKDANGGRSTWDRAAKVHRLGARAAAELPALAERLGLRVGDEVHAVIAAETRRQDRNRAAASASEAGPVPIPGLAGGMPLKPQQYPVVRFALEHRRVLVGDDMGWGKTASSLAAVAADSAWPAVVVCRPSLTLNWAAEITRFFPARTVYQAMSTTPQPVPPGTDVVIIGSAALAAKPRQAGGGKEFGWVTALAAAGPKALIIDEGQDTKERAANRSQACEQLAAAVIASDGLVLDLTGTAILNRPRELCQQLTILGRIGEFGGPKAFLWRYCLSETNQWGASYNGARNLIELHDRLRAWGIMIRRSDDAALGLPPCREHVLAVPAADLDPAVMARYRQAEADLLGYLAEQARTTAARLGEDPTSAAVRAAMITSAAQRAEHLVAIGTLRQLAGQAKRGYVTGWVREQVAAGEKVMIAAHHRDQVDAYAGQFGGLKLQGGQPVEEKETAKSAFQELPAAVAPVIAVAIGAGGVGHTLTAARVGIQAEQAWTPGETQQMKKRLHRIGQDRPVDYYITVAEGTIDEHLWQVVTAKQATLDAVLDGRSDDGADDDEASIAAELTWRLTRQGLGNPGGAGTAVSGGSSQRAPAATHQPVTHAGERGGAVTSPDAAQATPMGGRADRTAARPGREAATSGPAGQAGIPVRRSGTRSRHAAGPGTQDRAAPGDVSRAVAAIASGRRVYGVRDEVTIRHWREAHADTDKVRAWCRDTGRDEPPAQGPLPRDLVADYLAERGAGIPMPGGVERTEWLAQRPVLRQPFTARLGPFTVVYGPCPRCGHPTAAGPGQPLPLCVECASRSGDRGGSPAPPAGSGGPPESTVSGGDAGRPRTPVPAGSDGDDDDEASALARVTGQHLRQAAHRYLEAGLLPVPTWAARHNGGCCCPRGADCDRPGKHPRSVRSGPGPHDYSWKPLACHTHAEIDQRFAAGSRYAAGNLMVAIPAGMMAIDIDDDDGGRAAAAQLARELGLLPPTLSHQTPHGEHLIYRTPPGWTGRAWVGKDPANPVPPGIDLRMPGQVLMAAPSVVPGPDSPARYGPVTGDHVAGLPAAYVTAWTPPQPQPRPAGRRVPVPPGSAGRAARYLHEAMTRIAADLAGRQPGGRNAAAYAAGLKAGSLLGAARITPGARQAAAAWTDEEAEQALMDAAETNGYTGKDAQAQARRAIRSGLRNGLRNPRPARLHQPRPGHGTAAATPPARTRRTVWTRPPAAPPASGRTRTTGGPLAGPGARRHPPRDRSRRQGCQRSAPGRDRRAPAGARTARPVSYSGHRRRRRADPRRGARRAPGLHPRRPPRHRPPRRRHAALGRQHRRAARPAAQRSRPSRGPPHAGQPRGRGRQPGLPCRGPGPGPAAGRPGRLRGPHPCRPVAAAPGSDRRPAADRRRPGRARRRRPPAGPEAARGRPAARSAHARPLGRRPASTAPGPARRSSPRP